MPRISEYYFFLLILLLPATDLTAQLSLKLGAESGLYVADNPAFANEKQLEARLDAKLSYLYSDLNKSVQADIRIRPELYGNNDLSALKIKSTGAYFQREKEFNWGINVNTYYYNFSFNNTSSDFVVCDLRGDILKSINASSSFILEAGYIFRINRAAADLSINSFLIDLMFLNNITTGINLGTGIYIENFHSNYEPATANETIRNKNTGSRFGPMISIDYLGSFILRGTNYFLFHNSDITKPVSIEYLASFVFGKKISPDFSIMLLIDYYKSSFRFKSNVDSEKYLYFPSNIENQVAAKIGYDINRQTEIYFKCGYFKMDLTASKQPLTGWNLLVGIQSNL